MALTGKSTSLLFPHSLADAAAVASEGQWDNDGLAIPDVFMILLG